MRRVESLPALNSDRGRGLAELKGKDPMDRRIEVEKKERYAQALREQMALNAARRSTPRDEACGTPTWGSGTMRPFQEPSTDMPLPPSSSMSSASTPGPSHSGTPLLGIGDPNRVTAEKVAQVQDLMRQRLQSLQDEQQRQWHRIQSALQDQLGNARDAAEQAVQRQLASALQDHLSHVVGDLAAARRECAAQAQRAETVAQELAAIRRSTELLEAEGSDQRSRIFENEAEIDRLKAAHQECHRFRVEMQREQIAAKDSLTGLRSEQERQERQIVEILKELDRLKAAYQECSRFRASIQEEHSAFKDSLHKLRSEQEGFMRLLADVSRKIAEHTSEIEHLKAAHQDCARFRAEMHQDKRVMNENLAQLRIDFDALCARIADIPAKLRSLREEMQRFAEKAARDAFENARPAPEAPMPQPSVLPVSDDAFAVLRKGDEELYELPSLQNVVGRSPACNACIPFSQAISNRHMSVDFDSEGKVSIRDLGSRNGTFLNDRRVPQDAGLVLQSGDAIQLGVDGPSYVFEYGPAYYARWPREPERISDRRSSTGAPKSKSSLAWRP